MKRAGQCVPANISLNINISLTFLELLSKQDTSYL